MDGGGGTDQVVDVGARGHDVLQRDVVDKHVVDAVDVGVVFDSQGRGGVPLRIDVDDQHVQAGGSQGSGDVDRGGRLADAALLVGNSEDPGLLRLGKFRPSSRSRRLFSCASSRAMGLESSMESSTFPVEATDVSRETLAMPVVFATEAV